LTIHNFWTIIKLHLWRYNF